MTVLDDAAALIQTRLQELEAERRKLERALTELGGTTVPRPVRSKPPKRRRKPAKATLVATAARPSSKAKKAARRKAAKRSDPTRKQQVLAQIKADPSIRPGEIAKALGIRSSQVSNLLTALRKSGTLKRDKRSKKWVVA